ncbi:transcriptional regulator, TetR family [Rhizobium sp. RU35A]|uniref:TetR/AcrR family transcriptional regulator n=1 Tax=Rhizobium straminoryzae TaxID=1387186 RepID=A0A549THG0_9HYPH|nr:MULTISPECIES: TetR/AcrR family transcriptional regulator [Rhizobium]TRL42462.1 TetR/AcrR family transcriptional regulator [Rhizobium straminoryzae]SIQ42112.1 transcriptional regulator, TetR family [Rhizobium sp. RU35A]
MGRQPTINRDRLLDLAEEIVRTEGAKALTIDALAKAAGISKGGVQYSFASKDQLVQALVERWTRQFDDMLEPDDQLTAPDRVHRYIGSMRASQQAMNAKMAGLMIGYLQEPGNLEEARNWYRGVFARLGGDAADLQAARVAFLAVEGLFLMRIAGLDEDGNWKAGLDDVEAVLRRMTETPKD